MEWTPKVPIRLWSIVHSMAACALPWEVGLVGRLVVFHTRCMIAIACNADDRSARNNVDEG